ncbi:hypothetical protein ABPG74_002341 [Tetrahymena malaccensis]
MAILIFAVLVIRQLLAQNFQQCDIQNQYYDLSSQSCGSCQEFCNSCTGPSNCLSCQAPYFQDDTLKQCVKQCQNSQFQQKFFQKCVDCKIDNCLKCELKNQICEQCKTGWQLSQDQKFCQKVECLESDFYSYDRDSGFCTTNCPEFVEYDQRLCISLKKFSGIKMVAPTISTQNENDQTQPISNIDPDEQQDLPNNNSTIDQLGCSIPTVTPQQSLEIKKSNENTLQRDTLIENTQLQEQKVSQFEQKFQAQELFNLDIVVITSNQEILIFDLKKASTYLYITGITLNNLIDVFEKDGQIRFIIREIGQFQDKYKSMIICANLAYNNTINQYNLQYDTQYFSESNSQVIEHIIFDNNQTLLLVTQAGYEIINISGDDSDKKMKSQQNYYFPFKQNINQQYKHLKLLSNNQVLVCLINIQKIQIQLFNYNSTYIWQDLSQQTIILNSIDYLNFDVGIYQVLKVNSYLVLAYNNQVQKIYLSNSQQSITYSTHIGLNIYQQMNGIQKLLVDQDRNLLIVILNGGFQIFSTQDQKLIFEKKLYQRVIDSQIIDQYIVITYESQLLHNFIIFNIDTHLMQQFDILSSPYRISLTKQENPNILYVAVYYDDTIKLYCVSKFQIDAFQINAVVELSEQKYSSTLQALENIIYINTKEHNVIVLNYTLSTSSLIYYDSIYTLFGYFNIDNNYMITQGYCDQSLYLLEYSRQNKQNLMKIYIIESNQDYDRFIQYISFSQYILAHTLIMGQNTQFKDLKTQNKQSLQGSIIAQNDENFILRKDRIYKLFSSSNLTNIDITLPLSATVIQSKIYLINQQRHIIIKNKENQVYLYNIENQNIVQYINQFSDTSYFLAQDQGQIIFYDLESLAGRFILSQSIKKYELDFPEYLYFQGIQDLNGIYMQSSEYGFYFDFYANQAIQINYKEKQSNCLINRQSVFVGNKYFLTQGQDQMYFICDIYFNTIKQLDNIVSICYVEELDVFIASNDQNQIILFKNSDQQTQQIILQFSEQIRSIQYNAFFEQQSSIVITINTYWQPYLYLYDYISQKGNFMKFEDEYFFVSLNKIVISDDVLILFLLPSATFFKILKNGEYEILQYIQYQKKFRDQIVGSNILYNGKSNQIILFSVLAQYQVDIQIYDYKLNYQDCHLNPEISLEFVHSEKEGVIYSVNQQSLSRIDYQTCLIEKTPLQGIVFQTLSLIPTPIFIILDQSLDIIVVLSQDRLNIFCKSTFQFLGSLDYQNYSLNPKVIYSQSTNIISIFFYNEIILLDLWTPFFTKLYENSISYLQNNLIFIAEQNLVLFYDYLTGVLNTHTASNKYQLKSQLKLKESMTCTKFFFQFHKINSQTILAITSLTQFTVYDYVRNEIINSYSNSINCRFYSSYQQAIFCLEDQNVLKKFNIESFEFQSINTNLSQQLIITKFQVLSEFLLSFIDINGNLIIYNVLKQQSTNILQSIKSINKIEQVEDYVIVLNELQCLTVFQLKLDQGPSLSVINIMQFNDGNKQIFDFLVIVLKNSYTLIFSSAQSVEVHNIHTNQLITHLPTPCSKQSQVKQDLNYFYVLCSFQVNVFIKKTLKFVNFYKINPFVYSGLKDIQHLYQDIFALILYKNLILVQINDNQSNLLDFFSNLDNPMIYNIDFIYTDQQKNKLHSIKLQCSSYTNLFDIYYKIQDNNLETNNVLLTYSQQKDPFDNQENVSNAQYKVYLQGFNLVKYIIKMKLESTDLIPLDIYYDIFTDESIIEYQFKLNSGGINKKGIANLNSNRFILSQFQNLYFQTIILQVISTQTNFTLNPYQNMKHIKFNNVDFAFYNQTSCLDMSYLKTVALDQILVKDGILQRQSSVIKISNVQNILIKNLTIQNMKIYNSSLFYFEDINNIKILNINIIDSSIDFNLFFFINCQFISIQNIEVHSTNLISGNIFSFLKCQQIQFTDIVFNGLYKQNIKNQARFAEIKQDFQSKNLTTPLLNFQGCQNVNLNNMSFEKIQDLTLIQVSHYSYQNELQYYSSVFQIQNLTAKEINISNQRISVDQIFIIKSIQAFLSNVTLSDVNSNNNLINWDAQKQGIIENSQFKYINLFGGSIINMIDGQITLIRSNFSFVNSFNYPCALNVQQANQVLIIETSFKHLRTDYFANGEQVDPQSNNEGGAIKIKNYQNATMQFCLFYNCSALKSGGAIHASQSQLSSSFNILDTQFLENISKKGQGGAIYLSFVKGININKSNFESNSANEQEGGAIYLEHCDLNQFSNSIFKQNQAQIGGSLYYTSTQSPFFKNKNLIKNNIIFQNNSAKFYGKNIGSIPFWIGISLEPDIKSLKIVESFLINGISSGNYLHSSIYLNFIDEENNPLNFTDMQDMDTNSEKSQFQLQLHSQNNNQIIIQQGIYAILNQTLGLFELNFQAVYKVSQSQIIYLISNTLDNQGTYLKIKLNLQFRDCEIGEIVQESNQFIQCIECPQGKYSLKLPDMKSQSQLQCNLCPQEAYFCQGREIKVRDGFWRENNLTDNILECQLQSCSFDNPQSINGCLKGFVGPICNSCDSKGEIWGEQYGFKNNECLPCSSNKSQIIYFVVYLLCYFLYISYTQYKIRKTKILIYKLQIFKKIDLLVTSKLSSSSSSDLSILFKLFINYIQILACATELNLDIPDFFNISINIFGDPIKSSIKSLDCLIKASDTYPIWVHRIVIQLFNMFILQVLINLSLFLIQRRKYRNKKNAFRELPQIIKMTSILTYLFFQPSFTKILIEGLFCTKINNQYYLISDYTQNCNSYYYFLYELAFVGPLMLIWCIIIPMRLFFKLKQFQLFQKQKIEESQNIKNILAYGVMYHGYKNQYLYWEIIKIFLKCILMVVININQTNQIKAAIIIIVLIAYTYLLQLIKPHKNMKLQNTEKIFMFNLMSIFALLQIILNDDSNQQIFSIVSKIYIFLLNLIVIRTLILNILDWHQIQINEIDSLINIIKKLILKIKQKFPNQFKFLKFKQVKILRIHFLWKKVILAYKNKSLINSQQLLSSNVLNTKQINISIDNKINQNKILKPDKRGKDFLSKKYIELQSQFDNATENQIRLKEDEKIMTTSQITLCTENLQANSNLFKNTTRNMTFRTKEDWTQSQTINSEAIRLNLPKSFFETVSNNMKNQKPQDQKKK